MQLPEVNDFLLPQSAFLEELPVQESGSLATTLRGRVSSKGSGRRATSEVWEPLILPQIFSQSQDRELIHQWNNLLALS